MIDPRLVRVLAALVGIFIAIVLAGPAGRRLGSRGRQAGDAAPGTGSAKIGDTLGAG